MMKSKKYHKKCMTKVGDTKGSCNEKERFSKLAFGKQDSVVLLKHMNPQDKGYKSVAKTVHEEHIVGKDRTPHRITS